MKHTQIKSSIHILHDRILLWRLTSSKMIQARKWAQTQPHAPTHPLPKKKGHTHLAILCDLFGMVKWPFQRLSDLQVRDQQVIVHHLTVFRGQGTLIPVATCHSRCHITPRTPKLFLCHVGRVLNRSFVKKDKYPHHGHGTYIDTFIYMNGWFWWYM